MSIDLPTPRGMLQAGLPLAKYTWLRVGGPADWLFQPADTEDLAEFLRALPADIPVQPMGVGTNLIVRDGGVRGVVIRLRKGFNAISCADGVVTAGAAALDAQVAMRAAEAGLDLTFLRTIPGSIGGAVRMNAGCYGRYVADHLIDITAVTRAGEVVQLPAAELEFAYRHSALPEGWIVTEARFRAEPGDPEVLAALMTRQLAQRDKTQPVGAGSAGSTFRNPAGYSSTGRPDDTHELKAWKLIEDAGLRGHRLGGAQMSPLHPNFLLNTGDATAADLEALGELVRERVRETSGHQLEWEVIRLGEALPE